MRRIVYFLALVVSQVFTTLAMAQSLPYNPTSIFQSPTNADLIYILSPSGSSSDAQLAALNISNTLQASNVSPKILSTSLPFESSDNASSIAYLPSISASGSIGVYAGSCSTSSSLWIFDPNEEDSDAFGSATGNGTWVEMSVVSSPSISTTSLTNANFLASTFSFSSIVGSNDTQRTIYAFGGMCPTTTESDSTTWQSSATYSNNMLKLTSTLASDTSYGLSLSGSISNKPIAEAGFTITGLTPAYSNSSTGTVTQAQNFVLIGGHTKTAFINMSQVALFSLPQESWSFQSIDSTTTDGGTELAVKSTASQTPGIPDSRSGHTALLNSDGSAIVVFGGWVGDVNTPADPQLAILHLGSGFGGSGDWIWEVPTASGNGLASGEGIYGHGAVMLPGDVMMFVGGNKISSSKSRRTKRTGSGVQTLFLNTSSMAWVAEYTNPSYVTGGASSSSGSSGNSATSTSSKTSSAKKAGLGAGLGLGLAAIIGALIVYFWYSRRLKRRRREAREKDLQALSQSTAGYYAAHNSGMSERERQDWWAGIRGGEMAQREGLMSGSSYNSLGSRTIGGRSGTPAIHVPNTSYGDYDDNIFHNGVPSTPDRSGSISRKPVNARNARGYYQPTPNPVSNDNWAHTRTNSLGTAGPIHPIYEADEENENLPDAQGSNEVERESNNSKPHVNDLALAGQTMFNRASTALRYSTTSDPFRDPSPVKSNPSSRPGTSQSHVQHFGRGSPSPERTAAEERELEIKEWVADWAAADALLNRAQSTHSGRRSPTKESTGRTESNLSERSLASVSAMGLSRNSSTNQRSNSLTAFFSGGGGGWNPFSTSGATVMGLGSINENTRSNGAVSPVSNHSDKSKPPPSSSSATSSFTTAQTSQSFPQIRAEGESLLPRPQEYAYFPDGPSSPSKSKAAAYSRRQQSGWLGSLKRVFTGGEGVREYGSSSSSGSPTRPPYDVAGIAGNAQPRRTVSASADLWRRKQGPGDWEDSVEPLERERKRSNTLTLDGNSSLDEDWDIERAVERRVVQVMFTVPREKLRVVNADADGSDSGSLLEKEKIPETEMTIVDVKGKEREMDPGDRFISEKTASSPAPSLSDSGSPGKRKSRVQEIVENLENRRN